MGWACGGGSYVQQTREKYLRCPTSTQQYHSPPSQPAGTPPHVPPAWPSLHGTPAMLPTHAQPVTMATRVHAKTYKSRRNTAKDIIEKPYELTAFIDSTVFLPAMTASWLVSPGICSRALCQPHTLLVHRSPLTTVSPPSATACSNCASLPWSGDGPMAETSSWESILIKMGEVESGKVLTFSLSSERTRGSCVLPHSRREKS